MKTLFKKSISLFLTVLMIMSCWVWVAPQEAEAGNITTTDSYKVTVYWKTHDRNKSFSSGNLQYKTVSNYGWGTESDLKVAVNSFSDAGYTSNNKEYSHTFTVPASEGFPTVIHIEYTGGSALISSRKARCDLTKVVINDKTVWQGTYGFEGPNTAELYVNNGEWGTAGNGGGTYTWAIPHIVGFLDDSAKGKAKDINLTLNKMGSSNVEGSTNYDISQYTCYDQYGVKVPASLNKYGTVKSQTTYVSDTENSDDPTEFASDIWSKDNGDQTVVASPNLQISNPQGSTGKDTFYLVRKYVLDDTFGGEQVSKVSAKVNVTYPQYTVNFNAGLSDAKITADTLYTGSYSPSNYHGGTITVPTKTEADGYTFYGYWSNPQPTTGDASYNALTADFAEPCSTEDFNSYTKMADAEVNGDIVTVKVDGVDKSYYNAGVALDPSTAKTIDVSDNYANYKENWYGYWLSKDLTIKFYDVDGTFLGEETVKSGQTQGDIDWPTSEYIDTGYTTGAFKFKVDANVWENTDGTEINKTNCKFTKDLILTPKLTRESFTEKYAVSFINPNNGSSVTVGSEEGGNYAYRQNIADRANEAMGKIADTPADVDGNLDYSYELLGWSSVKPTTGKNYHILLEDADFDLNGTSIGLNSDWVVRNAATYYAVYRRHTKTYVVNFNYTDATGADATRQLKVKYGANLVPPTEYVPYAYVTKGFGYTFKEWTYTTDSGDATLGYAATIPFTSENIQIAGAALDDGTDVEPIVINATYGDPVATPYTVTFNYVDDKGEADGTIVTVKNEQYILQTTVDSLDPAEKWENEDKLYTFAKQWEITEGSATVGVGGAEKKVGDIINTEELTSLTPTSNIAFKAVYANPIPYFTVTYVDGANTFTDRVLQGSNVPEWTYKVNNDNGTPDNAEDDFTEDKIYTPEDYEGEGGTYVFQGWYDAKQTDDDYKQTNGNKITAADKVEGNLTLYSQFKFVPDKYTITFMNHDGSVQLGAGEFEKGQNIEALVTTATKAAQGRAEDETYEYLFLGWDKTVPTFCEGYDITYTALYKPVYKYYDVKWYNSKLVDGEWVADKSTSEVDGKTVETNLLATTHHTYNSKLYTPAVDNLACLEAAPNGQSYVFAGWYYNDAEGNAHKYERGMLVTAEMEFYATYTLTAKVHTVTTVVKGKTETYSVADNTVAVIPDPQSGWKDATHHDAFAGWYTDAEYTTEFDETAAITADTKIYAKFTESEHAYTETAVKDVPTYYAKGTMEKWCACNKNETLTTEDIAMLTDKVVPTGTIYLGGLGQWSSTDAVGGAALDKNDDGTAKEITLYANADTDVIITANDTGDVNDLYNPAGLGIGVKYIRAFIYPGKFETLTAESYGAAQQLTMDVYVDETTNATNNANFAVKLGDFVVADLDEDGQPQYDAENNLKYKELESGESYIVYYYVVDKAGNQLNRKVRTAKFIYDDTAPAFTVEGENDEATIPTYCGTATVTGLEKDVVLTVNGEVVNVTYAEGATTGTYEIEYAENIDNVIITATDKAGNTFSKKIKVADHSYITTEQSASCGVAGYKKVVCLICGDVAEEETYGALNHIYSIREVMPADCVNIGSIVVTCEICGDKVTTQYKEDGVTPAIPANGHDFAKDDNGDIIYTTVTASTCKTAGLAEAECRACKGELDGGYITKELPLDETNHEKVTETEVPADCVNNGYYTKACVCGDILEHRDHTTDPTVYAAKGHGETVWEVINKANCFENGTMVGKCSVCTTVVVEETFYGYTEDAEGEYVYVTETTGEGEEATEVKVTEEIDGKTYYKYYLLPATGEHILVVKDKANDIKEPTATAKGTIKWSCKTEGCTYTKTEEIEKLVSYSVVFYAEDGKTELKKLDNLVSGTVIGEGDAPVAPAKESTEAVKYTFAGWKVVGGGLVNLPLTVTKTMKLVPTYKETKIVYTHEFVVPTAYDATTDTFSGEKPFKKLVGVAGSERVPTETPVFNIEGNDDYTYEFKGWKTTAGVVVTDFTVKDDNTFVAYFEPKSIAYEVVFYSGLDYVWSTTVKSGDKVAYNNTEKQPVVDEETGEVTGEIDVLVNPTKDYDKDYHYSFKGWYADPDCTTEFDFANTVIKGKTRIYAGYNKTAHVLEEKADHKDSKAANCEEAGNLVMICDCGYRKDKTLEALGHDFENGKETTVNGVTGTQCSRCDEFKPDDTETFTVKFVSDGITLNRFTVTEGEKLPADMTIATPTKAADAQYTYTFAGKWKFGDDTTYTIEEIKTLAITGNWTFEAVFTETTRVYTVSYLDVDYKVLATAQVAYGETLFSYTGVPTKEKDDTNHYVFNKWDKEAGTYKIVGDTYVMPIFDAIKHDFTENKNTEATCEEAGKTVKVCTCGAEQVLVTNTPALGHTDTNAEGKKVADTFVAATIEKEGSDSYVCQRCGKTITTTIDKLPSAEIVITVYDADGNRAANGIATVVLKYKSTGEVYDQTNTNENGQAIFIVPAGEEWIVGITGRTLPEGGYGGVIGKGETSFEATPDMGEDDTDTADCSCSCHKTTFWGWIFRLFQKFIAIFRGGEIRCCTDPSDLY